MKTLGDLLIQRLKLSPKQNSVGQLTQNKKAAFLSFQDYFKKVEALSLGFAMLGIKHQDKVAIWGRSDLNWHLTDLALLCSGQISIPIHFDLHPDEVAYIWNHSQAEFLIVEDEKKYNEIENKLKTKPKKVIFLKEKSASTSDQYLTLSQLINLGQNEAVQSPDSFGQKINSLSGEHIATIVYTSGTTGEPKGAIITHQAIMQVLTNIKKFSQKSITYKDRFVNCLPLAHILGRCESFFSLNFGCECLFVESPKNLLKHIKELRPTFLVLVPLILERIQKKITENFSDKEHNRLLFEFAQKRSHSFFQSVERSENPKQVDILLHQLSLKFLYNKIHQALGGRLRFIITGGAPLQKDTFAFFRNIKVSVLEGYGLTETFAPCTVNALHKQYPESVGIPIGDVEVKFSIEGEILLKTKALFSGYYNNRAETENAFEDGWFKTGDLGHFSPQGTLIITGRKKDIIITSGGKNIAPQKIEALLNKIPVVNFSVVCGDSKEFLTALLSINRIKILSKVKDLTEESTELEISQHPEVRKLIQSHIDEMNKNLPKFEQIQDFRVLPLENKDDFLTHSLKVKRNKLSTDYMSHIEAMYH